MAVGDAESSRFGYQKDFITIFYPYYQIEEKKTSLGWHRVAGGDAESSWFGYRLLALFVPHSPEPLM